MVWGLCTQARVGGRLFATSQPLSLKKKIARAKPTPRAASERGALARALGRGRAARGFRLGRLAPLLRPMRRSAALPRTPARRSPAPAGQMRPPARASPAARSERLGVIRSHRDGSSLASPRSLGSDRRCGTPATAPPSRTPTRARFSLPLSSPLSTCLLLPSTARVLSLRANHLRARGAMREGGAVRQHGGRERMVQAMIAAVESQHRRSAITRWASPSEARSPGCGRAGWSCAAGAWPDDGGGLRVRALQTTASYGSMDGMRRHSEPGSLQYRLRERGRRRPDDPERTLVPVPDEKTRGTLGDTMA